MEDADVNPVLGKTKAQNESDTDGDSKINMTDSINNFPEIISQQPAPGAVKDLKKLSARKEDQA